MKRTFAITMMTAALILAVPVNVNCQKKTLKAEISRSPHLGTWQLASYKYGSSQSNFVNYPKGRLYIKLITETHFTWIEADTATGKVSQMAGGTFKLNGNTYTESIDYGIGMDNYLGHNQTFTVKVEGDMFFLSGKLNDGYMIEEIWQRIK